jgi:hypothetical protein
MRRIRRKLPNSFHGGFNALEHGVQRHGEPLQFVCSFRNVESLRKILWTDLLCRLNDAIHRSQGSTAEPIAEQRSEDDEQRQKALFNRPKAVKCLIERLSRNGRPDAVWPAVNYAALQSDTILLVVQIRGEEQDHLTLWRWKGRLWEQEPG